MIALIFISTFFLVLCPADQQTASQLTSTTPNMAVINYLDWKKCDSKQPFHSMKCQITSWASHLITLPVGYKRASKKEVIWSIWIKGNVQETSRSWQKRNIIFKFVANSRAYLVGVFSLWKIYDRQLGLHLPRVRGENKKASELPPTRHFTFLEGAPPMALRLYPHAPALLQHHDAWGSPPDHWKP